MSYDVLVVGAGPAGLAAAIRLKQLAQAADRELSVCVLEKGAEVGAHILSGAVIDPIALDELLPDWRTEAPTVTPVTEEAFLVLGERGQRRIPDRLLPPLMRNHGNYVASLGMVCRWLGARAEALGVEIYPGFPAAEALYDESGAVLGVITGDFGRDKAGQPKPGFTPGMEIRARYTLVAEGARGSLTKRLERRFGLRDEATPQHFGLGLKELWQVEPGRHRPGRVIHSVGWPLDDRTGGGGFLYHQADGQVAVGFVVHLDYRNPYLSPYEEFQRFKTHPAIREVLTGGKRVAYGARAITEGGWQSLPALTFPGGALIGCAAGMVNLPRIKGSHNAMKAGMLAAESAFAAVSAGRAQDVLNDYPQALRRSWVGRDLWRVRNVKPALARWGTRLGTLYAGVDLWCHSLGLKLPWTLAHRGADHAALRSAAESAPIAYPPPDGVVSFDRMSSVYLSNTHHEEDQPVHLRLREPERTVMDNLARFDAPEQRYCPAGVYEIVRESGEPRLRINASNCLHCKACDIKNFSQDIDWETPEGGGGPNYPAM